MKPSGVTLIDRALGGLAEGLPLVVTGASGCGRTVLSLQLTAAAIGRGETVVFLSAEPPAVLLRQAAGLELPLDEAVADGRLVLLELDPGASTAVRVHGGDALVEAIRAEAEGPALLVLESIAALTQEVLEESALRRLLAELFSIADASGGVPVVTIETERLDDSPLHRALKDVCGSHLHLGRSPHGQRTLSVEKSRTEAPLDSEVAVEIGAGGFQGDWSPIERRVGERRSGGDRRRSAPEPQPEPERRERPKILVVEDEAFDRDQVTDHLGDAYELVSAENGLDAVTAVLSEDPDLILLDLVMPKVTGYDVLRSLQASGSSIPILVLSGNVGRASDRVRALILGAADVLQKPANRLELRHKVEALLALPRKASRGPQVKDVSELLGSSDEPRILEEAGFRERLDRAHRFGQQYDFPSAVVSVRAPSEAARDRLVAAADETLRGDDAILRLDERRLLFLLVMTTCAQLPIIVGRLEKACKRHKVSISKLELCCVLADEANKLEDWSTLFEQGKPWTADA